MRLVIQKPNITLYLYKLKERKLLLRSEQCLTLLVLEFVPVVTAVVGNSQFLRNAKLILKKTKLKTLEPWSWGQIFPVAHMHTLIDVLHWANQWVILIVLSGSRLVHATLKETSSLTGHQPLCHLYEAPIGTKNQVSTLYWEIYLIYIKTNQQQCHYSPSSQFIIHNNL